MHYKLGGLTSSLSSGVTFRTVVGSCSFDGTKGVSIATIKSDNAIATTITNS